MEFLYGIYVICLALCPVHSGPTIIGRHDNEQKDHKDMLKYYEKPNPGMGNSA